LHLVDIQTLVTHIDTIIFCSHRAGLRNSSDAIRTEAGCHKN